MAYDIRLDTDFFDHRKTVKLRRKLGDAGIVCLIKLWIEARRYEPDGILDMSEEDIEERMEWKGAPGLFVNTLCSEQTKFLDRIEGGYFKLHNWEKRQPWAAFAREKSEIGRQNAMKRWANKGQQSVSSKPSKPSQSSPRMKQPSPIEARAILEGLSKLKENLPDVRWAK